MRIKKLCDMTLCHFLLKLSHIKNLKKTTQFCKQIVFQKNILFLLSGRLWGICKIAVFIPLDIFFSIQKYCFLVFILNVLRTGI